jgi:hypothetical protein
MANKFFKNILPASAANKFYAKKKNNFINNSGNKNNHTKNK